MKKVKVTFINRYKDGGTNVYKAVKGGKLYYKDGRRRSKTKGLIFDKYPGDKGAKILDIELDVQGHDGFGHLNRRFKENTIKEVVVLYEHRHYGEVVVGIFSSEEKLIESIKKHTRSRNIKPYKYIGNYGGQWTNKYKNIITGEEVNSTGLPIHYVETVKLDKLNAEATHKF